eukprot:g7086.t1
MTLICSASGYFLTRSAPLLLTRLLLRLRPGLELRDEVWEEKLQVLRLLFLQEALPGKEVLLGEEAAEEGNARKRQIRKRTGAELLFIVVHNSAVASLAMLAWAFGWPSLALHAFCLEIGYEVFDSFSLGFQRRYG